MVDRWKAPLKFVFSIVSKHRRWSRSNLSVPGLDALALPGLSRSHMKLITLFSLSILL